LTSEVILSQILSNLKGVKESGSNWLAICPAHDDKRQSLSAAQGDDGRVLLHCHAGCQFDDIISAIGLKKSVLFSQGKHHINREIVCAYDYLDEDGSLLFQVCRTADKRFFQRRPDGRGGLINGLGGLKTVLYCLPEVKQAVLEGKTIFIPEGEKDCDNLARLGLVATTNPMGAGKWGDEYSESLKGGQEKKISQQNYPRQQKRCSNLSDKNVTG
jgi:hypothetical protein